MVKVKALGRRSTQFGNVHTFLIAILNRLVDMHFRRELVK